MSSDNLGPSKFKFRLADGLVDYYKGKEDGRLTGDIDLSKAGWRTLNEKGDCNNLWIKNKYLTVILDQVTGNGVDITGFNDIEIGKMRYRMIRIINQNTYWFTDTQGNFYGTKTHYWGKNELVTPICTNSNTQNQILAWFNPVHIGTSIACGIYNEGVTAKEKDHHWIYHFECYKNCDLVTKSSRLEREKCVLEKPDTESASLPSFTCGGD